MLLVVLSSVEIAKLMCSDGVESLAERLVRFFVSQPNTLGLRTLRKYFASDSTSLLFPHC